MYPSFVIGRTVAGQWEFLTPAPVQRSEARRAFEAACGGKGMHEGTQYVEVAVYDVPRPADVGRFQAPPAIPPQTSAVAPGSAAKPGLGDAPAPAPDAKTETHDTYAARVEVMDRPKLLLEAHAFKLTVRVGTSNADLRKRLVDTKFPSVGAAEEESGV